MVLFRHIQKSRDEKEPPKEYVFGYFSASYWRLSPDISGNCHIECKVIDNPSYFQLLQNSNCTLHNMEKDRANLHW